MSEAAFQDIYSIIPTLIRTPNMDEKYSRLMNVLDIPRVDPVAEATPMDANVAAIEKPQEGHDTIEEANVEKPTTVAADPAAIPLFSNLQLPFDNLE